MGKTASRIIIACAAALFIVVIGFAFAFHQASPITMSAQAQSGGTLTGGQIFAQATSADSWGLKSIYATEAQTAAKESATASAKPVCIAVLDTGFYKDHPAIKDRLVKDENGLVKTWNVVPTDDAETQFNPAYLATEESACASRPVTPPNVADSSFELNHGTHVAGILSAIAPDAKLLLIRVANSSGKITSTALYNAYLLINQYQSTYNIKVVNFSGGEHVKAMPTTDGVFDQIDAAFYHKGIVTVCSAGNDAKAGPYYNYPSDFSTVVNVISLEQTKKDDPYAVAREATSNYNASGQKTKDISAPGKDIISAVKKSDGSFGYDIMSGTSMAAPHVAGTLALMFAANDSLGAKAAVDRLYSTATDIGDSGWDAQFGHGEVNALAAVSGGMSFQSPTVKVRIFYSKPTYTGLPLTPKPTVTVNDVEIKAGTDYDVTFSNNVNAGEDAKITVTGKGKYIGSVTKSFIILGAELSNTDITVPLSTLTYNGSAKTVSTTVTHAGRKLTEGVDYDITYANNVSAGTAKVIATGKGNYRGSAYTTFTISKAKQPMKLKGLTKSVKYSKVKKKAQKLARPISVKKAQGTVTYVKTKGNKKITVNKKTGKVTVKKGLKKGRYKIKIRVTAAGNKNYNSASKTVAATIRVK